MCPALGQPLWHREQKPHPGEGPAAQTESRSAELGWAPRRAQHPGSLGGRGAPREAPQDSFARGGSSLGSWRKPLPPRSSRRAGRGRPRLDRVSRAVGRTWPGRDGPQNYRNDPALGFEGEGSPVLTPLSWGLRVAMETRWEARMAPGRCGGGRAEAQMPLDVLGPGVSSPDRAGSLCTRGEGCERDGQGPWSSCQTSQLSGPHGGADRGETPVQGRAAPQKPRAGQCNSGVQAGDPHGGPWECGGRCLERAQGAAGPPSRAGQPQMAKPEGLFHCGGREDQPELNVGRWGHVGIFEVDG